MKLSVHILLMHVVLVLTTVNGFGQGDQKTLDERVQAFLTENKSAWRDWNVPYEDGKLLYDLILKNNYKSALEIGTSTGHSTVWIAWALSKTGGKLITIEINKERHEKALANLKAVGLSAYVDARLADAHVLVKSLKGPFDFVFSDADKDWYTQYFKDIHPKLSTGGCFTAHNVRNSFGGIGAFMDYVRAQPEYETSIAGSADSGLSISYRKK